MQTHLIISIDFKPSRTRMGLVDSRNGTILETVIFRTEKSNVDRLLSDIEHGIEIFNGKSKSFQGLLSGIGLIWPTKPEGREADSGLWQMLDEEILKNILEKRFSIPCRIESEDQILAAAETAYGAMGENAGMQGCAALFAHTQSSK